MIKCIETRPDGISLYKLENSDLKVLITSFGATLVDIEMKESTHEPVSVLLGYDTIEEYMAHSGTYFGALVGRTANRIARGTYTINGKEYHCPINNGPNSLHGGPEGFSYQNFTGTIEKDKLVLRYHSMAGEQGYPGNLDVVCTFGLDSSSLRIDYQAQSDQDTLVSLTHHPYFNLAGMVTSALDHELKIDALRHGCVDQNTLATGQFREVAGTPLDFREFAPVRQGLDMKDEQCRNANGIDHHFVFSSIQSKVFLRDPQSGRMVIVESSLPGAQIYSGNFIPVCKGRHHAAYSPHWGIAIEPQTTPDNIHNQEHPASLLQAGKRYHETITYTFQRQQPNSPVN